MNLLREIYILKIDWVYLSKTVAINAQKVRDFFIIKRPKAAMRDILKQQ